MFNHFLFENIENLLDNFEQFINISPTYNEILECLYKDTLKYSIVSLLAPEIILVVSFFFIILLKSFLILDSTKIRMIIQISFFICFFSFLKNDYLHSFALESIILSDGFHLNIFVFFFKQCILFIATYLLWSSFAAPWYKINPVFSREYPLIVLLITIISFFLISSYNLIVFLILIETLSVLTLVIMKLECTEKSTESTLIYYLISITSSILLLFSVSLIIKETGSYSYGGIAEVLEYIFSEDEIFDFKVLDMGVFFFFISLCFKISAFPLCFWLPFAYRNISLLSVSTIDTLIKFTILGALIPLIFQVFPQYFYLAAVSIIIVGMGSIFFGSWLGILENDIKTLLAYSSITHAGFFVLCTLDSLNISAVFHYIFYLLGYIISNLLFFSTLNNLSINQKAITTLNDLRYLLNGNLLQTFYFTIAVLSLAGLPPTIGFLMKYYILKDVWSVGGDYWNTEILSYISRYLQSAYYTEDILSVGGHLPLEYLSIYDAADFGILLKFSVFILVLINFVSLYYYMKFLKAVWFESQIASYFSSNAKEISIQHKELLKEKIIFYLFNYIDLENITTKYYPIVVIYIKILINFIQIICSFFIIGLPIYSLIKDIDILNFLLINEIALYLFY